MEMREEPLGAILRVAVIGRLTADCAENFRRFMDESLGHNNRIVLDLSEMDYIDSTGLGAIVYVLQRVSDSSGALKLAALQTKPRVVFDITKAYKIFEIYDTVEAARAAIEESAAR